MFSKLNKARYTGYNKARNSKTISKTINKTILHIDYKNLIKIL